MFVILLNYKKSITEVDKHLEAHIAFLDEGYEKNYFFVSGRKEPKTGGVILSQLTDRALLEKVIKQDPFHIHQLADFEIVEFTPRKYHPDFSSFVSGKSS